MGIQQIGGSKLPCGRRLGAVVRVVLARVADEAVEAAGLDEVDPGRGRPVALVVAGDDLVVRADAHAVGGAEAGGDHFAVLPVGRFTRGVVMLGEADLVAAADVVEVAVGVGPQIHREGVVDRGRCSRC